jgi:hypothetical protein
VSSRTVNADGLKTAVFPSPLIFDVGILGPAEVSEFVHGPLPFASPRSLNRHAP